MTETGIFVYGCFVFAFVAAALALIVWGIVAERRDRLVTEREQARPERLQRAQAQRARQADAELAEDRAA